MMPLLQRQSRNRLRDGGDARHFDCGGNGLRFSVLFRDCAGIDGARCAQCDREALGCEFGCRATGGAIMTINNASSNIVNRERVRHRDQREKARLLPQAIGTLNQISQRGRVKPGGVGERCAVARMELREVAAVVWHARARHQRGEERLIERAGERSEAGGQR